MYIYLYECIRLCFKYILLFGLGFITTNNIISRYYYLICNMYRRILYFRMTGLNNFVEPRLISEANNLNNTVSKEIPYFSWNPKIH